MRIAIVFAALASRTAVAMIDEFVAAHANDEIGRGNTGAQPLRSHLQQAVADSMTRHMEIVDLLEVVDVEIQDGDRPLGASWPAR